MNPRGIASIHLDGACKYQVGRPGQQGWSEFRGGQIDDPTILQPVLDSFTSHRVGETLPYTWRVVVDGQRWEPLGGDAGTRNESFESLTADLWTLGQELATASYRASVNEELQETPSFEWPFSFAPDAATGWLGGQPVTYLLAQEDWPAADHFREMAGGRTAGVHLDGNPIGVLYLREMPAPL